MIGLLLCFCHQTRGLFAGLGNSLFPGLGDLLVQFLLDLLLDHFLHIGGSAGEHRFHDGLVDGAGDQDGGIELGGHLHVGTQEPVGLTQQVAGGLGRSSTEHGRGHFGLHQVIDGLIGEGRTSAHIGLDAIDLHIEGVGDHLPVLEAIGEIDVLQGGVLDLFDLERLGQVHQRLETIHTNVLGA